MITTLDFVAVPSQDSERSRRFYGETLGLRPIPMASSSSGRATRVSASGSPSGSGWSSRRRERASRSARR